MHCGWIVLGTVCSNKPTHDPPKCNLLILCCFARFHIDSVRVLYFPSIVFLLIPALFFLPSMRCWPVLMLLFVYCFVCFRLSKIGMRIVFHKLLSITFVLHAMNGAWLCQLAGLVDCGLQNKCIHVLAKLLIQFFQTTSKKTGQTTRLTVRWSAGK